MSRLFQRQITVSVINKTGRAVTVENLDGEGLRVAFNVHQSVDSKHNTADVLIYNLAENSRAQIANINTNKFTVEAGYRTSTQLFSGKLTLGRSKRLDTGWETKLSATDGLEEGARIVNMTLSGKQSIANVIEAISKTMGVNVVKAVKRAKLGDFDGAIGQFANGLTLSGPARIELDKLTASIGADWSIQDGELQILLPDETNDYSVVLTPKTGLIGSPEMEMKKVDTRGGNSSTKRPVMKCRSLLQGDIRPGTRVQLDSQGVKGDFRVITATHVGDTDGAEWYTEIEGVMLSTVKNTPSPTRSRGTDQLPA